MSNEPGPHALLITPSTAPIVAAALTLVLRAVGRGRPGRWPVAVGVGVAPLLTLGVHEVGHLLADRLGLAETPPHPAADQT